MVIAHSKLLKNQRLIVGQTMVGRLSKISFQEIQVGYIYIYNYAHNECTSFIETKTNGTVRLIMFPRVGWLNERSSRWWYMVYQSHPLVFFQDNDVPIWLWLTVRHGKWWPIEIDGLPIKNGDFPWQTVSHNQRVYLYSHSLMLQIPDDPIN